MPSFDIVSEVDLHELSNAVDQANREVANRFDFKGSNARYDLNEQEITQIAQSEFQVQQMLDILYSKLTKRGIDLKAIEETDTVISGKEAKQVIKVKQGIETESAKKIVKLIKESKLKVQAAIQGEKVRVTGKKRDDLQEAIAMLKQHELDLPLQFNNFRE
jgi:uncharacterized protein YajQ (UPF0234 family)